MVKWEYSKGKVTNEDISRIETETDLSLPKDLVDCVLKNNRATPTPDIIKDQEIVFNYLYSFNTQDDFNVLTVFRILQSQNNDILFPFADDPFGNDICLLYINKLDKNPVIVFRDHETEEITFIASSFSELVKNLE